MFVEHNSNKIAFLILAAAVPLSSEGLEVVPWFGNVLEFQLKNNYTYSNFRHVQGGEPQLTRLWNNQRLAFSLEVPIQEAWGVELELEFVDTPRQSWGMRSFAGQFRYLFLNDVAGDPVSLMGGLNLRGASVHSLKDVSSPYHSNTNVELNGSIGKEWSHGAFWWLRCFGFTGVGVANHGSLWLRSVLGVETNYQERHQGQASVASYWGFGKEKEVQVDHFHGYGKIHHQSIDLAAGYTYRFPIWGKLNFTYAVRLYARAFPEYENFFSVTYTLPFSFF